MEVPLLAYVVVVPVHFTGSSNISRMKAVLQSSSLNCRSTLVLHCPVFFGIYTASIIMGLSSIFMGLLEGQGRCTTPVLPTLGFVLIPGSSAGWSFSHVRLQDFPATRLRRLSAEIWVAIYHQEIDCHGSKWGLYQPKVAEMPRCSVQT